VKEREGVSVSLADQRGESLPGSWVAGLEERESGRVLGVRARRRPQEARSLRAAAGLGLPERSELTTPI
jgi:hypothetical protein